LVNFGSLDWPYGIKSDTIHGQWQLSFVLAQRYVIQENTLLNTVFQIQVSGSIKRMEGMFRSAILVEFAQENM
jgi:hypothetical protein